MKSGWKRIKVPFQHKHKEDSFFLELEEIDEEELRRSCGQEGAPSAAAPSAPANGGKKRNFDEFIDEFDEFYGKEEFIDFDDFDFENDCLKSTAPTSMCAPAKKEDLGNHISQQLLLQLDQQVDLDLGQDENLDLGQDESIQNSWSNLGLFKKLSTCLVDVLGFIDPTEIQKKSLSYTIANPIPPKKNNPTAIRTRDIIAASETGSGKTLAYGLPILQHLLLPTSKLDNQTAMTALILVPTRELALQVQAHIIQVAAPVFGSMWAKRNIVTAVGGLSKEKQMRLLKFSPRVLIATPGRLWALTQEEESVKKSLGDLAFLVIDEADRMLEPGHFKQLDDILAAIDSVDFNEQDEDTTRTREERKRRATFIYSATMVDKEDLQLNLTHKSKKGIEYHLAHSVAAVHGVGGDKKKERNLLFRNLLKKIKFQDPNPIYINLSSEKMVAAGVEELKISCTKEEKDLMLYYLLMRASSLKIIVFVNSISAIRRLVPILTFLRIPVFGLHAEMQQQQRLKSLERFKGQEMAVLVCSDVAARGLDVPKVDQVIQYHLPRSADSYIHRSGRTARGQGHTGSNICLVSPAEMPLFSKLCRALGKEDMSDFNLDSSVMSQLGARLVLAKQLDSQTHTMKRNKADTNWFKKAALDADIAYSDEEEDDDAPFLRNKAETKRDNVAGKLNALLENPIRIKSKRIH